MKTSNAGQPAPPALPARPLFASLGTALLRVIMSSPRRPTSAAAAVLCNVFALVAYGQGTPPELAHLFASDGAAGDGFGWSVAISGQTAVVGAYADDTPGGADAGSAYVYVQNGGVWVEQAHLFAADGAPGDGFGLAVAIDGETIVVGAHLDNTPLGQDAGSAYVFVRNGTVWTQQAKLTAVDGATDDRLGVSVALSGEIAVLGAPGDDVGGSDSGSAYVFVRSGTVWTEQALLFAEDGVAFDAFGLSVALSGNTAIMGAWFHDTEVVDEGSAYVFVRSGSVWSQQARLEASDSEYNDFFGTSVAISDDTAVVGAYTDDTPGGENAGSAYVFVRTEGVWTEQAHLVPSDSGPYDFAGNAVAIAGDTAGVGGYLNDTPAGEDAGSAYVYTRSGDVWVETAQLFGSDSAADDLFGSGVALAADAFLVGAFRDDTASGANAGSAYCFGSPTTAVNEAHGDPFALSWDLSFPAPNPSRGGMRFGILGRPGDGVRLELLDVTGRVLHRFRGPTAPDGSVTWNGRLNDGRSAPAGVYVLRATTRTDQRTRPVVVIK